MKSIGNYEAKWWGKSGEGVRAVRGRSIGLVVSEGTGRLIVSDTAFEN
jgi:hypothetical protein